MNKKNKKAVPEQEKPQEKKMIRQVIKSHSEISLVITNNTTSTIPMSFMGNPANTADISNQLTSYAWDITGLLYAAYNALTLTFRNTLSTAPFTSVTSYYTDPSLNGILVTLNSLGVSSFYVDTTGGSTVIKTYNDTVTFTTLNIFSNTTYGIYIFLGGDYTGIGGSWSISENTVPKISGTYPVANGDITGSFTQPLVGATIAFAGFAGSIDMNFSVVAYNLATGTSATIFSSTVLAGNPIGVSFVAAADTKYTFVFNN